MSYKDTDVCSKDTRTAKQLSGQQTGLLNPLFFTTTSFWIIEIIAYPMPSVKAPILKKVFEGFPKKEAFGCWILGVGVLMKCYLCPLCFVIYSEINV